MVAGETYLACTAIPPTQETFCAAQFISLIVFVLVQISSLAALIVVASFGISRSAGVR